MCALPLFQLATLLNTQNAYEKEIHKEFREINMYMDVGIFNWHIWSIDPTKMTFLPLFHFKKKDN